MALTDTTCKNAKPKEKVYKLGDSEGLAMRYLILSILFSLFCLSTAYAQNDNLGIYSDISDEEFSERLYDMELNNQAIELREQAEQLSKTLSEFENNPATAEYDILKRNPRLAEAYNSLKTRDYSKFEENKVKEQAIAFGENMELFFGIILVLLIVGLALIKREKEKLEGFFLKNKQIHYLFWVCYGYLFMRMGVDFYVSVAQDSALNFIIGLISLFCLAIVFFDNLRNRFFPIAGTWLFLRGILNVVLFVKVSDGYALETLTTMPLAAVPSIFISYVLPFAIGGYFIYRWKNSSTA